MKQQELDNANQNNELDRKNKIDIAMIQAGMAENAGKFNLEKAMMDQEVKSQEVAIKAKEADEEARSNRANEEIKREANKNRKS